MQAGFWRSRITTFFLLFGLMGCSTLAQSGVNGDWIGIPVSFTNIGEIQQQRNPDATVYVKGKVVKQVPLLNASVYALADDSGQIWILTQETMPQLGDEISIRGKLRYQSIPVEGQDIGEVYVEEIEQIQRQPALQ